LGPTSSLGRQVQGMAQHWYHVWEMSQIILDAIFSILMILDMKKNSYIWFMCVTERTLQLMPRLAFRNSGTGWSTGSHLTSHIHLLHKDMMSDYKHPDGALFSFTCFVGQGTLLPNRTLLLTMSYLLMQQ
jgi:hypothetical protein